MNRQNSLHEQATLWVTESYSNAEHLVKTEEWVLKLEPEASEALRLAALTHDMERAFPGPDSPKSDPTIVGIDHEYYRAHSERSATIVGTFLQTQSADEELSSAVQKLIRVHEYGGWPEANLLQAADSLSFLEVNISLFLRSLDLSAVDVERSAENVHAKFDWMYERIQLPEARILATSLHAAAIERLEKHIARS